MSKAKQMAVITAASILIEAAKLAEQAIKTGESALALTRKACDMALAEGIGKDCADTNDKRLALIAWGRLTLTGIAGANTVKAYLDAAAPVALLPDTVAVIETGTGDKASKREVSGATATTKRDLVAVAEVARRKMGAVERKPREKAAPPAAPAAPDKGSVVAFNAAEQNLLAKGYERALDTFLEKSLDVTSSDYQPQYRLALIAALARFGFKLAPVDVKSPAPRPAATIDAPATKPSAAAKVAKAPRKVAKAPRKGAKANGAAVH